MGSSRTRDQTRVSCIGRQILGYWATREAFFLLLFKWRSLRPCHPSSCQSTWLSLAQCFSHLGAAEAQRSHLRTMMGTGCLPGPPLSLCSRQRGELFSKHLWQMKWCLGSPERGLEHNRSLKSHAVRCWLCDIPTPRQASPRLCGCWHPLPITRGPQGKQMIQNDSDSEWEGEIRPPLRKFAKQQRKILMCVPCYFNPAASCHVFDSFEELLRLSPVCRSDPLILAGLPCSYTMAWMFTPALRLSASQADFPLQKGRPWPPVTAWLLWGKGLVLSSGLTFPHQTFPVLAHHLLVHVFRGSLGGLSTFKG